MNSEIKKRTGQEQKREWTEIRTFQNELKKNPDSYRHPREYKAETGIIAYLAAYPEEAEYVSSKLAPEHFVTEFNRKVYEKIQERIKNSAFYDILSLQSEFTADEMGKITEITVNSKDVNINKTVVDDFINILVNQADNPLEADKMSDDDFLEYIQNMKKKKKL